MYAHMQCTYAVYMHAHMHVSLHTTEAHTVHAYMHSHMQACKNAHTHAHAHTHTLSFSLSLSHTHTHTHKHTHTYTHTDICQGDKLFSIQTSFRKAVHHFPCKQVFLLPKVLAHCAVHTPDFL